MGLDIEVIDKDGNTIDSWRLGAYSSYMDFRREIAVQAGVDLDLMDGHGGTTPFTEETPLRLILDHSDCNGDYSYDKLNLLEKELEQVLKMKLTPYSKKIAEIMMGTVHICRDSGDRILFT